MCGDEGEGEGKGSGCVVSGVWGLRWERGSGMVERVGAGAGELEAKGADEGPRENFARHVSGGLAGFG